jgi:hypothetical protein
MAARSFFLSPLLISKYAKPRSMETPLFFSSVSLFGEPVRVDPCKGLYQGGLAVVDMSGCSDYAGHLPCTIKTANIHWIKYPVGV